MRGQSCGSWLSGQKLHRAVSCVVAGRVPVLQARFWAAGAGISRVFHSPPGEVAATGVAGPSH